eukprot:TRINITY_DN2620_c5_g1_i1.p1 TRINITY_DN2620_c5_g1~~TRINITY_DN2620_c5_g1_i1.p1  ORF type:complete len:336 (-),score=63.54 TRINITY_DN2620_c5_g1_i1:261-1268(-)
MSTSFLSLVLSLTIISVMVVDSAPTFVNPVINENAPDPGGIFVKDTYYVATTSGNDPNSFPIHASKDLVNWHFAAHIFPQGKRPSWTNRDFWAPELHILSDNSFVVYYTARDHTNVLCVGAAKANNILGPYVDRGSPLVRDATGHVGNIDPTFFLEEDGTMYLIWKEDGNDIGKPTDFYAQQVDATGINLVGEKHFLFRNSLPWEGILIEGPWMIKHANIYYLLYSGNTFGDGKYAVGVARASSILGPYTKRSSPILHTDNSVSKPPFLGPGHCSVVPALYSKDKLVMFYHGYHSQTGGNRTMLIDPVIFVKDSDGLEWPSVANNVPSYLPTPVP